MTVDLGDLERKGMEFLIVNTPQFSSEVVALFLAGLRENADVVFFGCGKAGELLVENHAQELVRHRIRFVTSTSKNGETFKGYPLMSLAELDGCLPDYIMLLSKHFEKEMLGALEQIPRRKILTLVETVKAVDCRGILEKARAYINDTVLETDVPLINAIGDGGKPLVCFTTMNPSHNFLKIMMGLKKQGYGVILVLNNDILNNAFSIGRFKGAGYFDYLYVTKYSYPLELLHILKSCQVSFVHAVSSMAENVSLAYVIANSPCPVVVEYCDVKQLVFEGNDTLAQNQLGLTPSELDLEKKAQEIVYTQSNGVIIKDSPEIIDHLGAQYGKRPNWMHFFPYTCQEFVVELAPENKFSHQTGKTHIVYAGCLHNNPKWHPTPIFRSTLDAIRMLTDQGIYFSIYNAMDSSGKGFEEYLDLSEKNEFFNYHFALPYDQLTSVLSRYDLGWFCFDFSHALESPFFHKTTFGSKVFTYIEAGLPILVSPEQEYMCSVVEALGVGRALKFQDIENLTEILEGMDFDALSSRIAKVRKEMTWDTEIPRIIDFYRSSGLDTLQRNRTQDHRS